MGIQHNAKWILFSKATPSFVPCLASSWLSILHHYLTSASISFNIISTFLVSSQSIKVFSSLSQSLEKQKSFSIKLPSAVNSNVLRKQHLPFILTHGSLASTFTTQLSCYSKNISNFLRTKHIKMWLPWSIQSLAMGTMISK